MILFDVVIAGRNVSSALHPVLEEITVSDGTDNEADSASIVLADVDGGTYMANARDDVQIKLGRSGIGAGTVFEGFIDEPRSQGGRDGRKIALTCKSVDLEGAAKEKSEQFWDDKPLGSILQEAFAGTGISLLVDPSFSSMIRDYESMDGRNPLTFAADMAREVGATFKMMGKRGVFAQRNTAMSLLGSVMPVFVAAWGDNLIEWDITPVIPRSSFAQAATRWFDFDAGQYKEEVASLGGRVPLLQTKQRASQALAGNASQASKVGAERDAGAGSVTVKGDFRAQAGGKCQIVGARPGVDGTYVISSVEHSASVANGFTSMLELKHPEGGTGIDPR